MTGTLSAGDYAIAGLILALWIASMGAAWKVATILASIAGELKDLRTETVANRAAIDQIRATQVVHTQPGRTPTRTT